MIYKGIRFNMKGFEEVELQEMIDAGLDPNVFIYKGLEKYGELYVNMFTIWKSNNSVDIGIFKRKAENENIYFDDGQIMFLLSIMAREEHNKIPMEIINKIMNPKYSLLIMQQYIYGYLEGIDLESYLYKDDEFNGFNMAMIRKEAMQNKIFEKRGMTKRSEEFKRIADEKFDRIVKY